MFKTQNLTWVHSTSFQFEWNSIFFRFWLQHYFLARRPIGRNRFSGVVTRIHGAPDYSLHFVTDSIFTRLDLAEFFTRLGNQRFRWRCFWLRRRGFWFGRHLVFFFWFQLVVIVNVEFDVVKVVLEDSVQLSAMEGTRRTSVSLTRRNFIPKLFSCFI